MEIKDLIFILILTASLIMVQATATSRYKNTARMFRFAVALSSISDTMVQNYGTGAFLYQTYEYWPIFHHWYRIIRFCTATCLAVMPCGN